VAMVIEHPGSQESSGTLLPPQIGLHILADYRCDTELPPGRQALRRHAVRIGEVAMRKLVTLGISWAPSAASCTTYQVHSTLNISPRIGGWGFGSRMARKDTKAGTNEKRTN
jgi:hypothetical protein